MSIQRIQEAVNGVIQFFGEHPEKARSEDTPATATVVAGLRCRTSNGAGFEMFSDMPQGIGGSASAPTPGWFMRGALASCDATMIALRAAELGISLTALEVTVDSTSDDRGMLEIDDSIPAGPLSVRVLVKLGANDASEEQLQDLVAWTKRHSPVGDAISRAVPLKFEVKVV